MFFSFFHSVGENSGKASKSVAKHIPGQVGIESLRAASGGAMSEVAKARIVSRDYKFKWNKWMANIWLIDIFWQCLKCVRGEYTKCVCVCVFFFLPAVCWCHYLWILICSKALQERGEKVSELEQKTAEMMAHAENFAQASHQLMNKYKDKKWYQFWGQSASAWILMTLLKLWFGNNKVQIMKIGLL